MKYLALAIVLALLGYYNWPTNRNPGPSDTEPPAMYTAEDAIDVKKQPKQVKITPITWVHGKYTLEAVATYSIDAILMDKATYRDYRSDITPMDFAVAWGPMSDAAHRGKDVEISMGSRSYNFRYRTEKFSPGEVGNNTANIHLIPKNNLIYRQLKDVANKKPFRMVGYLVNVSLPDGDGWKTSLLRNDEGMGACETMWVEEVKVR